MAPVRGAAKAPASPGTGDDYLRVSASIAAVSATTVAGGAPPAEPTAEQAAETIRSKRYVVLLVIVAIIGVVVSLAAWCFLEGVAQLQKELYTHLPHALGYDNGPPLWWPLPVLGIAGILVALAITRLPGDGGHLPAKGLAGGPPTKPIDLPGVILAAGAAVGFGLVVGPEAPLIALGAGGALLTIRLARREMPPTALQLIAAAGSFATLSFLFDSPLIAAVILIEATGIGGPRLPLILLPGLLAAGIGSLVSIGMGSFTGLSTKAYALSPIVLPQYGHPTIGQFGWTILLAIVIAIATRAIMLGGLRTNGIVKQRLLLLLPIVGLVVAGLAIAFHGITSRSVNEVLFSGQERPLRAGLTGRNLDGRRACVGDRVQGHRVQPLYRLFPRRADVPRRFPGRRRRDPGLAPPGLPADAGGCRRARHLGHRCAPSATVGHCARHAADCTLRHRGRAADHRRGRRRLRRDGVLDHARPGAVRSGAGIGGLMSVPSIDKGMATASWVKSPRAFIAPLALAQFICSFAGSNMNVMITDISHDLNTDVKGVQTCITLFLLIMAVLMIPCSTLTDRWGRKRCFLGGLILYGIGTVLSAIAPGLGILILGNSVFQGVGTAFLIPPVYILTTMAFTSIESRAKAFGVISGLGGIGAAAGPLIGGLITSGISWRAAFVFQALVVCTIIVLGRRVVDPVPPDPTRPFDATGAVLSAVGMFCLVFGILQAGVNNTLLVVFLALGAAFLAGFFAYIRARERAGKDALLSLDLFKNRTSNLGMITQNLQWLLLMGVSFVVSVFLQTERHYSAIKTGVIFTAATVGVLVSSLGAERLAKRYQQKTLISSGFVATAAGIGLLLGLVKAASSSPWAFAPGLLLIGLGLGVMLTPSVNIVQGAFPEDKQGEISGLSRSVSNLGSTFGTAIAGTILVSNLVSGNGTYVAAMIVLAVVAVAGFGFAFRLPANPLRAEGEDAAPTGATRGALDPAA